MPVDTEVNDNTLRATDFFSGAGVDLAELPAFIDAGILLEIDDFWCLRFSRTYLSLFHEAEIAMLPYSVEWLHTGPT